MIIDCSPEEKNALISIVSTELGIVTDLSELQYSKACSPIVLTEFGIVTDWSFSQFPKDPLLILLQN